MKKLIIARHGIRGKNRLHILGEEQAKIMLKKIKEVIGDNSSIVLFCSTASWTVEFANLLGEGLQVVPIINELFLSKQGSELASEKAVNFIVEQGKKYEVVIIVTHFEYASFLPEVFGNMVFGRWICSKDCKEGDASIIDIETQTLEFFKNKSPDQLIDEHSS